MTEPTISAVTLGDIPYALKQGRPAKGLTHAKDSPAHKAAEALAAKVNTTRKPK